MNAVAPTPMGSGTTGKQWFMTAWKFFVASESLKTAFKADGTPFVVVTDAQIATNHLLHADGSPRYPIVFSLANEAVADNEIDPLRNYVNAGGFLFVGSSSFTRNTNGTARSNFALASEMGLNKVITGLTNWGTNLNFTKIGNHRLVSHVPSGTVKWRMPFHAEQLSLGISPNNAPVGLHWVWRVNTNGGAQALANGSLGPVLATKSYGQGRFIYHSAMQPLVAHGGFEVGMFAYAIYREAVEWAFEAANIPLARVSPWRYQHDAAFIVRHDFETFKDMISQIEASAAFEKTAGARGEYYFCTGYLRDVMPNKTATIASLRRALTDSGALFGSHNGGLGHPVNTSLSPTGFDDSSGVPNAYWHWGPDEALDVTPPGYPSGKAYAKQSVLMSFQDYETWFAGLNYGPRIWASPAFNSTREDSFDLLQQLGVITVGEQKVSPFPHWTMSKQTPGKHYAHLTVPTSEWFDASGEVIQAVDDHTSSSMRAAVDFYYRLGTLINLYGHFPSLAGTLQGEFVTYTAAKPRIWSTTSVDLYSWSLLRSNVTATSTFTVVGGTGIVHTVIAGTADPDTAIEVGIPNWTTNKLPGVQVFFNGSPALVSSYRATAVGVRVRVGTAVQDLELRYALPTGLSLWSDTTVPDYTAVDGTGGEVGLKFQSAIAGQIVGLRFHKGPGNSGTHSGRLWSAAGSLLSSVTFSNETASGWQQQDLSAPLSIDSNTTYVVSCRIPNGHPSITDDYFLVGGYTNGPLRALPNSAGGNGVFLYGSFGFPTNSDQGANFWVDIVFVPATNSPSLIATDQSVLTIEDSSTNLVLSGIGGGGGLSYGILTEPTNGVLSGFNASSGAVTYTPAADYYGVDSFRFTVSEGSLVATGVVSLTIGAVNDAPTLTLASNEVVVLEDSGPVTVGGFATFSPGPANESAQTITNVATLSLSDATLFAVVPTVSPEGTLSFTPAADRYGVAEVTIQAQDDGGSAHGGTNGSGAATLTITITAVNDAPVVANPIPDQFGMYGAAFEFEFDANTFADVDGDALGYTVSGLPAGLGFDGNARRISGVPEQAGEFTVEVAAADDGLPALSVTNAFTLSLAKAPATVWLNGLAQTYDGTARVVTAGTEPEALGVTITYDGDFNAPTNAGSYQAVGTINDANHAGAATNTLTVSPAALTASAHDAVRWFGAPDPVFSGSITGVQDGDELTASYSTTATAASPVGSYAIVPVLVDPGQKLGNYEVTLHNGWLTILGVPRLLSMAEAPEGNFKLLWAVSPQRSYEFQFKDQLGAADWLVKTQFTTAVNEMSVELEDEPGVEEHRFYRLVDVTPP
ncbi:MAG: DUF4082 domain-containing protein [Verrucomicrobiae bacterium]|nr:DUF4082 domain-containing protein [Verrucomicrobiae bacterium]